MALQVVARRRLAYYWRELSLSGEPRRAGRGIDALPSDDGSSGKPLGAQAFTRSERFHPRAERLPTIVWIAAPVAAAEEQVVLGEAQQVVVGHRRGLVLRENGRKVGGGSGCPGGGRCRARRRRATAGGYHARGEESGEWATDVEGRSLNGAPADMCFAGRAAVPAGEDEVGAETLARRTLMDSMLRAEQFRLHGEGRGRPAWPVEVMLRILVLQKDEPRGDRRMVQRLRHADACASSPACRHTGRRRHAAPWSTSAATCWRPTPTAWPWSSRQRALPPRPCSRTGR